MKKHHHIYFAPGMFGFARLASYDYFAHVRNALIARFKAAGIIIHTHTMDVLPTASVRRRAAKLAALVERTSDGKGPIHLVGHSSGGLDARLLASPSCDLGLPAKMLRWLPRLKSVTTMNTPHYGTPLASFFVTASGQRALFFLSAFTLISLTLGSRPLGVAGKLLELFERSDELLGVKVAPLERWLTRALGMVKDARRPDVLNYINAIKEDQGSMLQISPEAMDLTVAGFGDRPGVLYQSTVSMAPPPSPGKWVGTLGHPLRAASLGLFTALQAITARANTRYPCAAVKRDKRLELVLTRALGHSPKSSDNDGIVPIRSQLWGKLAWVGYGDHLDVLGHYRDDRSGMEKRGGLRHHDWLSSGSAFDGKAFQGLMDRVGAGMLAGAS